MPTKSGRKVYRNSSFNKKKRVKRIFSVLIAIIVIALLVFLGYSIAKPIINYFNSNSESLDNSEQTEPWTPPVVTEAEAPEQTTNADDSVAEETTVPENNISSLSFTACELPIDAITTVPKLNEYLTAAKSDGYSAVIVTMKAEGGKIYYNTESEFARSDENAVNGTLPAAQIASIIKSTGLKAFASLNLLEDNNRYGENRDGSYHSLDGTTWLDNSVAKGGKPWLSPFDSDTQAYAAYLADEISLAGFDTVIANGVTFPTFRNSDYGYIGDFIKSTTRYQSLISLVDVVKASAEANNSTFILELNASDIVNQTAEVFKPDELAEMTILVNYNPLDFNNTIVYNNQEIVLSELNAAQKFAAVFNVISEYAGENITIIPSVKYSEFNQADFNDVITELLSEDFSSYIVK